jgi:hypothetical protein
MSLVSSGFPDFFPYFRYGKAFVVYHLSEYCGILKYMRVPTVYLETTMFNFPFADDSPQYKADTLQLFAEIKAGKFKALITENGVTVLPKNDESIRLASLYVAEGIMPEKYMMDAFHIAAATVAGLDFIVSLNFRHIVKHKTIIQTEIINAREGFKRVFIYIPAEVISHDENG